MKIEMSFDKDFEDLFENKLKKKYPKELFDLDGIGKQLDLPDYTRRFFDEDTLVTADISIDANANVDDVSVIAYDHEVGKPLKRLNSYYYLWKKISEMETIEIANYIMEAQLSGDIYINDFHGIAGSLSYCYNYSCYDIMAQGLPMIKKIKSIPPKHLMAYKSQVEQFTVIAANSTLGATGLADFLVVMSYYVKKLLETKSDAGFKFATEEDCWRYVKETLVSFIYTVNQPMRGNQSCFTNISIYDENFMEEMNKNYTFPDGSHPDHKILQKLQEIYLEIMNEELKRTPITFPVTTACFSIDDNRNVKDKDFLEFIAKKNEKWGFLNIYAGKSSTLSSCCFSGVQRVLAKYNGRKHYVTFDEIYNLKPNDLLVPQDGQWVSANIIRLPKKPLYKIDLSNGAELIATEDHIHFTLEGEKETSQLTTEDSLLFTENIVEDEVISQENISFIEQDGKKYIKIDSILPCNDGMPYVYCFEVEDQEKPYFTLPNGIITHNCRLRSDSANEYFNSFGSGTTKIGSLGVCTINLPRLAFKYGNDREKFFQELEKLVKVCSLINRAKRVIVEERIKTGHHPLYDLGFLNLEKQYLTCGINGFNEAIEIMGEDILQPEGTALGQQIIDTINRINDEEAKKYKMPHNCEQIPAENVAVKLAKKDKLLGYNDRYALYSNQFIPLTTKADLLDRIYLQGQFDSKFTGGSIMHCNCETEISWQQQMDLIEACIKNGVVYFAINYNLQECTNGHMSVGRKDKCAICNAAIENNYLRVVGFLTCVKNWSPERRTVDYPNREFYDTEGMKVN